MNKYFQEKGMNQNCTKVVKVGTKSIFKEKLTLLSCKNCTLKLKSHQIKIELRYCLAMKNYISDKYKPACLLLALFFIIISYLISSIIILDITQLILRIYRLKLTFNSQSENDRRGLNKMPIAD